MIKNNEAEIYLYEPSIPPPQFRKTQKRATTLPKNQEQLARHAQQEQKFIGRLIVFS